MINNYAKQENIMGKTTPKDANFSNLVVRPIENAYIVEIEGLNEDKHYSFKSLRQVLNFLKTELKEGEAENE